VQGRLFAGDIGDVTGNSLHEFSQAVNVAAKLFLRSGKSAHLSIERFGVDLEGRGACDALGDQFNSFGADVLDSLAKLVYMIMDGPVVLGKCLKSPDRFVAPSLDGLVQGCLLTSDRLHEFSQAVNVAAKLFLRSGKSAHLSIERFGVGLERLATRDPLGDRFNCFGTDVLDILTEVV